MNVGRIFKANTLEECYAQLADGFKIIAGGTDVVVKLNEGHIDNIDLVDISSVKELKGVSVDSGVVTIGAGTTFTEVIDSNIFPDNLLGFVDSLKSVGSPQIRNAGTIGGNICNGSPAADSIPPLVALEAKLLIGSKKEDREIKIDDFFLGKGKVALKEGELLKSISFVIPSEDLELRFYKYSLRNALSITLGSIAVLINVTDGLITKLNLASGGFSAYCQREPEIEEILLNSSVADIDKQLKLADDVVQKRIEMFDSEFKIMKNITLSGALRHVLRG